MEHEPDVDLDELARRAADGDKEALDELLAKGVDGKVYRLTGVKKFDTTGPRVAQGSISPVRVDASGVVVPGNRERTPGVTFAITGPWHLGPL